jgi:membrane-associated phospholipid phosphatase
VENIGMTSAPNRTRLLAAAGVCAIIVAVLGLMVHARWDVLQDLDTGLGAPAEAWSFRHAATIASLLAIEAAFGTIATSIYTLVLVAGLWLRGHHRAGVWTVAVMVGTSLTTTLLKLLFRRHRPEWTDPVHSLTSFSFPSGHASSIASGMGVVVVLTVFYVNRRPLRLAVFTVAALLVVLVGADRILLGVHNLSDVLAGYAVAGCWLFAMLALYPPELPGHQESRLQPPGEVPDRVSPRR